MIRWSCLLTTLVLALLLGACGSSPSVRYFALETITIEHQRAPEEAPVLAIGPLRVPDYLKRSQMVRRGPGAEMIIDDFNRWAESVNDAIGPTIASNVDGLLDKVVVVAYPSSSALDINYRVFGRIDRFDVDSRGSAVLDVQWGIGDSSGNVLAAARRARYESQAGESNDPAAMAQAMSETLEKFSRDIATEVDSLLR